MANVRVGDIDLSLFLPPGNWDYLYPPAEGDPQAQVDFYYGKTPLQYEHPTYDVSKKRLTMICPIDNDGRPWGFSEYDLRRNVAFLVSIISKKFWFIQAAGFIYNNKGIMLVGTSGSGKTTLISLFEDFQLLDDDLLFTDGHIMKRVSNASIEYPKPRLTHDRTEHPVDYVFLLNKEHQPNYLIQKKEQKIPYKIAFDDSLPDNFFELYKEKPPVTFSCPVYEVGTKNEPIKSKELIESVIRTPGRK